MLDDTIVAEATPPGFGGVSIVRVSGKLVPQIIKSFLSQVLTPRVAAYLPFFDEAGYVIDIGIAIYFAAPFSFTGEEVLEIQGHGGPVVVQLIIERLVQLGARLANPGEFSERAFLNNKIDLTQAEGILDLIHASSKEAAKAAVKSLQGDFAKLINDKVAKLLELRTFVEAAIDFSDEEIEFLGLNKIAEKLQTLIIEIEEVLSTAKSGQILRDGISIVITGKPNVGKSSLLNKLCMKEAAIVTSIPGTTRDVIREALLLDGIPLTLIDTAGIRETEDEIELEGIIRAQKEIANADLLLNLIDIREIKKEFIDSGLPTITVFNKIDLINDHASSNEENNNDCVFISAKTGIGIDHLKALIKKKIGFKKSTEGLVIARQRHLKSLTQAKSHLIKAAYLMASSQTFEIMAEELRLAQLNLNEITGVVTNNDLLGNIFKSFCIGK